MSHALPLLLLASSLVAAGWFVRPKDRARGRDAMYRAWVMRALAAFLLPVLVSLAVLNGWATLAGLPAVFLPVREALPALVPHEVIAGALGGTLLGLAVAAWRARAGGRPIGNPGALMPRDRHELPWGLAVAIVAGTTEEPFFRLLLPLLITLATGNAWAGFGLATLIFGAMHRYQGWRGMVATTLLGAVMAWVYLESGALWLVVLLHMLVDLNGLVIWPALRIQSTPSAASPSGR
ncbi:CPBP family glutamic-type intramembrane protease [Sphingomonas abaci]|uniref:Membrane protease YdiL (CAAX protease family) n=1 Tax=Sphingomonas abaci TaxID=237611 RepID=A0A7W7AI77_9SPHN|nr:membrane protease YdiL (CAAX protease family) [Sphingomonas abaci]